MKKYCIALISISFIILWMGIRLWSAHQHSTVSVSSPVLKRINFNALPGFSDTDTRLSFKAFQHSCRTFLRQDPNANAGTSWIPLKVRDWQAVCRHAADVHPESKKETKNFFTTWFSPYLIVESPHRKPMKGIFTGYYVLLLQGSFIKTERFMTPLYGLPKNLVTANLKHFAVHAASKNRLVGRVRKHALIPYYTRAQINAGAIDKSAPILAWVESAFDRQLLEIEGSGIIEFPDHSRSVVGYAGDNGAPYTSIAQNKHFWVTMSRLFCAGILFFLSPWIHAMGHSVDPQRAIDHAVVKYGLPNEPELEGYFTKASVAYPPKDVALLAFKREQQVQLWAKDNRTSWRHIHTYPLTAFSGRLGPKLKERDRQIPEGVYRLTALNPFSSYHLSMMINYPNDFDRLQASKEGRRNLGGNIFVHGKSLSVGCLAVGDHAIEQLFLLTRRVGLHHVRVIIAPNDLRRSKPLTNPFAQPRWLPELYKEIALALQPFAAPRVS